MRCLLLAGTTFVYIVASLLPAFQIAWAAEPSGNAALDALRKQYEASSEKAAAKGRPARKDANFQQKLGSWMESQREQTDVGQRLGQELLKAWAAAKDGSSELEGIQKELRELCDRPGSEHPLLRPRGETGRS
jgi:hypothetical protein